MVVKDENYGIEQFYTVQVTNKSINIYNREHHLIGAYSNPNIKSVLYMDDSYLYCLANPVTAPIQKYGEFADEDVTTAKSSPESAGLYVYDLARLVNDGIIELYKL